MFCRDSECSLKLEGITAKAGLSFFTPRISSHVLRWGRPKEMFAA